MRYFVIGIFAYFSSFLLMELISLKMKKFIASTSKLQAIWPSAMTTIKAISMRIVHLVLSKKFLLIFSPKWVLSIWVGWGAVCFLPSSGSENYVDVGSYISYSNFIWIVILRYKFILLLISDEGKINQEIYLSFIADFSKNSTKYYVKDIHYACAKYAYLIVIHDKF